MTYSKKQLSQLVVESCVVYGVEHVIISPGSRNAPLTIGFTNHPKIKTYSVADERCAAFFGLGIAQQTQKPVALVCTSGSALLNYYPAIAEAFYSNIPLIVISADRPKHMIDIGDGQTIRQENVFINHSLFNSNLIEGENFLKESTLSVSMAFETSIVKNGPVHINVPFDEPLYETTYTKIINNLDKKQLVVEKESGYELEDFTQIWNKSAKKLILIGSHYPDGLLQQQLNELIKDESVIILTETTSNVHHPKFINSIDKVIFPLTDDDFEVLKPDILLTLGGMVVSKKVKQLLRNHQPKHHWHVNSDKSLDTFHCLSHYFKISPTSFFNLFLIEAELVKSNYQEQWLSIKEYRDERHKKFISNIELSDVKAFDIILSKLPNNVQLQLGNSSVVRYAQLFDNNPTIAVFCNRGTSGIDGSTSTAIGAACASKKQTVFITGDISFFYDSNALWNNYIPANFRIIVINNGGGGIFKILPGPQKTNASDYFETPHNLTAENLCEMYGLIYKKAIDGEGLLKQLDTFFDESDQPKVLEIFTPNNFNDKVLKSYFKAIK